MKRTSVVALGLVAGVVAVLAWQATRPEVAAPPAPKGDRQDGVELRSLLESESAARAGLEDEVEDLERRLADLEQSVRALASVEPPAPEGDGSSHDVAAGGQADLETGMRPEFDVDTLVEAGLRPDEAEVLRDQYEQAMLDRLYLRDSAIREGWIGSGRLRAEQGRLEDELRQELGPERYDLMLYGGGRHNRILIQSVLGRSAASEAGLRAGDRVRSYGGRPVFTVRELRTLTTQGEAGEYVSLEVEREGRLLRFDIVRGPIGVTLRPERVLPEVR